MRPLHAAFLASCTIGLVLGLPPGAGAQTPLHSGDWVRVRFAPPEAAWHTGRFVALTDSSIAIETPSGTVTYDLARVVRAERRGRNGGRMLAGALYGGVGGMAAGAIVSALAEVPDRDVAGYALASAAGGVLVGTALGSGPSARRGVVIGGAAGLVLGTVILSSGCEQDSPAICPVAYGGGFGTVFGVVVGAGIGLLIPSWIEVEGLAARVRF